MSGRRDGAGKGTRLKQLARVEYFLRHLKTFAPYLTPFKALNLAMNAIELRLMTERPRSLPPYLKIEPTPLCHLACPGCGHGEPRRKQALFENRVQLTLAEVRRLVDPISHAVLGVSLSLRGEPLLGKDLIPIIEYCHRRRIAVSFPSNLSIRLSSEKISRLICSGVDAIYVSLDGASAATYDQYRIGGNFDLVLRNVKLLSEAKRTLKRSRPRIVWKFVIFSHNEHEVPLVESTFARLGFDAYEFVHDHSGPQAKSAQQRQNAELVAKRKGCFWAWHTMSLRADGVVSPCCHIEHDFDLGNTRRMSLAEVWRDDEYARLRRGFKTMSAEDLNPYCARCLEVTRATERPDEAL